MTGEKAVLVVDDQDGVRQLLYEVLQTSGFNVYSASNGNEAIDRIEQHDPDIVLLDMKMPGKSGIEVLKELNKREFLGKCILMTAYGELDIINEAEELGVKHQIDKPFDINDLQDVVNKVCQEIDNETS